MAQQQIITVTMAIAISKRITSSSSSSRHMDITRLSNARIVMGLFVAAISICTANAVASSTTVASLDQVCENSFNQLVGVLFDSLYNIKRINHSMMREGKQFHYYSYYKVLLEYQNPVHAQSTIIIVNHP